MNTTDLHDIAIRQTAHAVLTELLNVGTVVNISVVPSAHALGYVHFEPKQTLPTSSEMERHITVLLAGSSAETLLDSPMSTGESSSLERASQLSQQLADMQAPEWRRTQPGLPIQILERCRTRATALVTTHKDHIIKVATVLASRGTLTGEQLAAL